MKLQAGLPATVLSWLLVVVTATFMAVSSNGLPGLVGGLMVATVIAHSVLIFIGSPRLVIGSSTFVLAAVIAEGLKSDDPLWVQSLVVGLLWYVAMEVSWHALECRNGTIYTRRAVAYRVQEVAGVAGLTLALGLVAIVFVAGAPGRSVALQALALAGVLGALAFVGRQLLGETDGSASIT